MMISDCGIYLGFNTFYARKAHVRPGAFEHFHMIICAL